MSLWFYDPFRLGGGNRQLLRSPLERALLDPFAALDHFFDDHDRLRVRDHAGQLKVRENGDFTYAVNVAGFRPEELKVDLEGEEVVVQGSHREQKEGESVFRSFERRFLLPKDSCKESLKCDLTADGKLCIEGVRRPVEEGARRSIPIGSQPAAVDKQ